MVINLFLKLCFGRAGSGGGTSGRAMAFCLGRPGLNPGLDLGFFQFRIALNLFSLGVGLFLIAYNRMVHTLPSSFLFLIIIYHCENYHLQANNLPRKRRNKSKKMPGKAHILKMFWKSKLWSNTAINFDSIVTHFSSVLNTFFFICTFILNQTHQSLNDLVQVKVDLPQEGFLPS